jgi:hypothetical protein
VCAQRELHRQPGVRVGQLVAEQLLELVDPVPDGLRVHVEARGDLPVRAPRLQPHQEGGRHAVALLGGEIGECGFGLLAQLVGEEGTPTASIEVTRPQEIDQYARMFGVLAEPAVYGRAARDIVTRIIGELA